MARWFLVCIGLTLLGLLVGAQEKPDGKPATVVLFFEDATLDEVMTRVAERSGYKVLWSRTVDRSAAVTLDAGAVSIDLACMLIADYTDLTVVVSHRRKLIEMGEPDGMSLFATPVYFDTRKLLETCTSGEKAIGSRHFAANSELREVNSSDAINALESALVTAIRFETGLEHVSLTSEGLTARVGETENDLLTELFRLLGAENGGRSHWLEQQSETWEKLKAGVLNFEVTDKPLAEVLALVAKTLGINWVAHGDAHYRIEEATVSFAFDKLPALDVLDILLASADLRMILLGNVVYVLLEDADTFRYLETGYAVYEIGTLIGERAAASKDKSDAPKLDAFYGILEGLAVAIDSYDIDIATFGTRLVIRGDSRRQQAVTDYLTALGWKAK